jgi:hypothetical protein
MENHEYVSVEEACRRLGGLLKPNTIRNRFYEGRLGPEQGVFRVGVGDGKRQRIGVDWPLFEAAVIKR